MAYEFNNLLPKSHEYEEEVAVYDEEARGISIRAVPIDPAKHVNGGAGRCYCVNNVVNFFYFILGFWNFFIYKTIIFY